jgi:hypothetical protein
MAVEIGDQLKAAKREAALRRRVYPRWVEGKRMTQAKADDEIAAMDAIVETLERLEKATRLL